MTWTSFSVRVREKEAAAFRLVARYRGFPSVGAWLASLGAQEVKHQRKGAAAWKTQEAARLASLLVWQRGTFAAAEQVGDRLVDREVEGIVSSFFGIFRQPEPVQSYVLVHLPTGRHLLSLPRRKDCQEAAEELRRQEVAWHESDPYQVMVGPGVDTARAVIARARNGAWKREAAGAEVG